MRRIQVVFGITLVLACPIYFLETNCHRFSPEDVKMERLFQALQNPDDENLSYVVEKLARSGTRRATDALLSALNSTHPIYRSYIATGLGFVNDDRATPALLQALRNGDQQLQYSAARALGRRRDSAALDILLSLIKGPSPTTRCNTIYALRMMRNPRVFDALRNALQDPDDEVRAAAVRGIALSGDSRAIEVLYSALNDNAMVSSRAAESLALMPDNSGIVALTRAFENPDPSLSLPLEDALYALKRNGLKPEALINFLLHKLESGPDALRIRAAEGLASFEDNRVIDALIKGTADPNPMVRTSSMRSLHRLNNTRADAFILKHAKNRSSNLHVIAAQAVCDRIDPRNSLLIAGFLKEQDVHVQFSAVTALISMADPQTIPAIRAAAAQKNKDWIQEHILTALGKTLAKAEDPHALEVLSSILQKKPEPEAEAALATIRNPRAKEILAGEYKRNPQARYQLIQALGRSQNPMMSAILIDGLKDKDPQVRRLAAEALVSLPSPTAEAPLIECLDDPNSSVELAAIKASAIVQSLESIHLPVIG
jgi:HEAT repeat protein